MNTYSRLRALVLSAAMLAACDPSALETKTAATKPQLQKMKHFDGVDQLGQAFSLSKVLSEGPVVVIFYRGHW